MEKITFGQYVAHARHAHDLTKSELARRVGSVPQYVTDIEKDRTVPSEDRIEMFVEILHLDKPLAYKLADKLPPDLIQEMKSKYYAQAGEVFIGD